MTHLRGKRLAVVSNVHRVHDGRTYYRQAYFAAESGMQVCVLALDDGVAPHGVDVEAFAPPKSRLRRFFLGWRLAYETYRRGVDVCHFHDPELLLPMTVLRLATRVVVIYDCHENVVDSIRYKPHIPRLLRPLLARLTFLVQWVCARVLGSVVVATKEQLEMFPETVDHAVVRNFPPEYIQTSATDLDDRPYDLVHCGTLSAERGSRVLFETLALLVHEYERTDCRLLLIGVAEEDLDDESRRFIEQRGLRDHLGFRGRIPLREVPAALSEAKIGLMCHQRTSQYRYGVASKLFDYMASGLAIVGGRADFDQEFAPAEVVKIYVDETRPEEYAASIDRLLRDMPACRQMGANARRLFLEQYTAEREAAELLEFYQRRLATAA